VSVELCSVFEDTELSRGVKTLTVTEGLPVVLQCSHYVSVPRATITWYSVNATSRDHWSLVDQIPVRSDDRIAVDDRGTASLYMLRLLRNNLPAKCRNSLRLTVETFRKHLKTYLFETAFITAA